MTTTKKMTKREYFTIIRAAYPADAANIEKDNVYVLKNPEIFPKNIPTSKANAAFTAVTTPVTDGSSVIFCKI